ncbi:MAG TPA: sigma-70 family RNA polymerase sigma factor [Kofleriaceae bacterium]|nr:sigma-70 family RNA polymerase sigma factor [Kofleriaceae bacterium]
MTPEAVLQELDGLRALARSLVHGDADADDLLQDTAVAALEHPPALDHRPVRAWLGAVLRNRWRMDRRSAMRRQAREHAALAEAPGAAADADAPAGIGRARALEKLAAALVALDEPFRTAVIRRYLDGRSAAELARELGIPASTVRWRLRTGLSRLRAALDDSSPRWHRAFLPFLGVTVKTKTSTAAVLAVLVLLALLGGLAWWIHHGAAPAIVTAPVAPRPAPPPPAPRAAPAAPPVRELLSGQVRASVEPGDAAGGLLAGRVVNWATGDGVAGAELTFTSDAGAATVRSRDDGGFELAPPAPGRFTLAAAAAPGFLPYAPELLHSTVHVALARGQTVRGITVFLFPALDYRGRVVDAHGAPAPGAHVRLLGTPAGEQIIDRLETEWTADRDGGFTFHAADGAVLEATQGAMRGWAQLDSDTAITRQLTIALGDAAPRDATITGRTIDAGGGALADVLIRASPTTFDRTRSTAFATSGPDGTFTLRGLDRDAYDLDAEAEDRAPASLAGVHGGSRDVTITLDAGLAIAGQVLDGRGAPAPAYTLLVFRHEGVARHLVVARSLVDPRGRFEVRVARGSYELIASAPGWAPSAPTRAEAGARDVALTLSAGATLRGTVVDAADQHPIGYARVVREASSGGASIQPANAGAISRPDGTFELTGIPPGLLSVTISAPGFNPRIESGMTASDGATLGPLGVGLTRLAEGQQPVTELVGIGIVFAADGDELSVTRVIAAGGAEAAGIVAGDRVSAIDGLPVAPLGVDGAVAKIRGIEGTTITVTVHRGDQQIQLIVTRRKLKAS